MVAVDGFNPENEKDEFTPIPAGWYEVAVTKEESRGNKKGNGTNTFFTLTVLSGDHEGRTVVECYCLDNPSEQAVRIARSKVARISIACGFGKQADGSVKTMDDTLELQDIPFMVELKVEKRDDDPSLMKNVVKKCVSHRVFAEKHKQSVSASASASTSDGDEIPF